MQRLLVVCEALELGLLLVSRCHFLDGGLRHIFLQEHHVDVAAVLGAARVRLVRRFDELRAQIRPVDVSEERVRHDVGSVCVFASEAFLGVTLK